MEICISLGPGPLYPLPSIMIKFNSISTGISLGLGLGVGHCKRPIPAIFQQHISISSTLYPPDVHGRSALLVSYTALFRLAPHTPNPSPEQTALHCPCDRGPCFPYEWPQKQSLPFCGHKQYKHN